MSKRFHRGTPARLAALFIVVTTIPLVVLGWIGHRSLNQERDLERRRDQEALGQTASLLVRELESTVRRVESAAISNQTELLTSLGTAASIIQIDSTGQMTTAGAPLLYRAKRQLDEVVDERLQAAQRAALRDGDCETASVGYRRAANATDVRVSAAAMVGLAGCLIRQGRREEALAAYADLAAIRNAEVAGFPAELVARRERAVLLNELQRSSEAAAEQTLLRDRLVSGTYAIDRPTFDEFAASIPNLQVHAGRRAASEAGVIAARERDDQPSGLTIVGGPASPTIAVWRPVPAGTVAVVAPLDALLSAARWPSIGTGFVLSIVHQDGRPVWNSAQEPVPSVSVSLRDLGLPASLRLGRSGPAEIPGISRETVFIAAFTLLAGVIMTSGYFVFRSMRRELEMAQLQSEFVATVSHEFRSPLTAMRHLTETLEEGNASPDRLRDYYRALASETRRLQGTVESVLDFDRIESGRTVDLAPLDAADVVQQVASDVQGQQPAEARVTLHAAAPAPVLADRDALALAVRNLLDNALKYSPAASPVQVDVRAQDRFVSIAVQDRGPGLAAAEQREIFGRFVRGSAARTLNVKGTGLGLAIVDRIVRADHGQLTVDSTPGEGSVFTIILPRADPSAPGIDG